ALEFGADLGAMVHPQPDHDATEHDRNSDEPRPQPPLDAKVGRVDRGDDRLLTRAARVAGAADHLCRLPLHAPTTEDAGYVAVGVELGRLHEVQVGWHDRIGKLGIAQEPHRAADHVHPGDPLDHRTGHLLEYF